MNSYAGRAFLSPDLLRFIKKTSGIKLCHIPARIGCGSELRGGCYEEPRRMGSFVGTYVGASLEIASRR